LTGIAVNYATTQTDRTVRRRTLLEISDTTLSGKVGKVFVVKQREVCAVAPAAILVITKSVDTPATRVLSEMGIFVNYFLARAGRHQDCG
jgi:hypothetical protein